MSNMSAEQFESIRERTLERVAQLPRHLGRYRIRGELGHGGMGIVYDAVDPTLERRVAVKVIHRRALSPSADDDEVAQRFEREMKVASAIFHRNVVAILDAGVDEGEQGTQAFYVMERVAGDSLEEVLRRRGTLPRAEALQIASAVARGLAAAHAHGLVHRDLKPSNVLLPVGEEARIADFGLCSARSEIGPDADSGAILGSAHYIAPEQLDSAKVSPSADLFSLGAIVLRMVSGFEPFGAASMPAHIQRILHDEPDGLDELDPGLRALVERLLAKRPGDRPPSAEHVADELDELARSDPEPSRSRRRVARGLAGRLFGRGGDAAGGARTRWLALGLLLGVSATLVGMRNQVIGLDEVAENQWQQIDNQLARRSELIPKLVQISKVDGRYRPLAYELSTTVNRIAVARARYNDAVTLLNQRLRQLPWSVLAADLEARILYEPSPEKLRDIALEL